MKVLVLFALFLLVSTIKADCVKDGQTFPTGSFDDPSQQCTVCDCLADGSFTCQAKTCETPACGKNLISNDGCCDICSRKCWGVVCPEVNCPESSYKYADGSCCPHCGCLVEPLPPPPDYVEHPCDRCRIKLNGQKVCRRPACEEDDRIQCVDPDYDECCNYVCPNGKTCKHGDTVIKYGEFKIVKTKVCTCVGDWYPRAFCTSRMNIDAMADLEKKRCVADASKTAIWAEIEALYA